MMMHLSGNGCVLLAAGFCEVCTLVGHLFFYKYFCHNFIFCLCLVFITIFDTYVTGTPLAGSIHSFWLLT